MAVTPLVAIIGRANVGKSTLFNRLVGSRTAITSDVAGTTRDAVYGTTEWGGRHFMLVDTAGIGAFDSVLENQLQAQISAVSDTAAIIVLVVDGSTIINTEDRVAAKLALKTGKPIILAVNKMDSMASKAADEFKKLGVKTIVQTSAIHGSGTGDLLDQVVADLPKSSAPKPTDAITVAIVGRPNVGKSSLLNSLVGKQKAIVADLPGTTRDVTTGEVKYHGREVKILDTAGLRRSGKIEAGVEKFSALRTLSAITAADVCILVMDANELSVAGDQHIAGMVKEAGKGLILVANKWDIVDKDDKSQAKLERRVQRDFQFVHWAPLVFTAASTGLNVAKLLELTHQISGRRTETIKTTEFNKLLQSLTATQPPAGLKNRQPKLRYATQTGSNPPTFTIFGAYTNFLHFSYKRYLENGLRAAYDFTGTPIALEFRDSKTDKP